MGSKDTLLDWCDPGLTRAAGRPLREGRIWEHGQRRGGNSGWVRNRKTGDAGLRANWE